MIVLHNILVATDFGPAAGAALTYGGALARTADRSRDTLITRNDRGRSRIASIDVELVPEVAGADPTRGARCEQLFEDFCTVTASVRQGIPVNVSVKAPANAGA